MDICIQNFHLGRYIVGYMIGNMISDCITNDIPPQMNILIIVISILIHSCPFLCLVSVFYLFSVAEQTVLSLTSSETPKTDFLASQPILWWTVIRG